MDVQSGVELIDGLKMSLRTRPMSFVLHYVDLGGLDCLLDLLTTINHQLTTSHIHASVLGCIKALMNSTVSISPVAVLYQIKSNQIY